MWTEVRPLVNLEPRRNNEPELARTFCEGESTKSDGEPRLIARTWLRMAAYGDRLPRLTLKAGRKGGCKAGQ